MKLSLDQHAWIERQQRQTAWGRSTLVLVIRELTHAGRPDARVWNPTLGDVVMRAASQLNMTPTEVARIVWRVREVLGA